MLSDQIDAEHYEEAVKFSCFWKFFRECKFTSTSYSELKMKKKLMMLTVVAATALGACAKKADNIEPASISTAKYDGWSCSKLAREKAFVDEALVRVSASQDKAASNDALMVFIIGVPTSGGGTPGEVARLKGEQEAIRRTMVEKTCKSS